MRTRIIAIVSVLFCSALLSTALQAREAEQRSVTFGVEGGLRYDNNVAFSPDGDDEFDVFTTQLSGGVDWNAINTRERELVISGDLFYNFVSDLNDLSNYGVTATGAFRNFFGSDLTAPFIGLDAEFTYIEFDDSEVREGYWMDWRATVGKRLNQRFGISGGLRYFQRWQDNDTAGPGNLVDGDEVFDQDKIGGFAHVDYFAGPDTTLFFEFTYFDGDVAATAQGSNFGFPPNPQPGFAPIARDPAVGEDQFVWRLDADQYIVEAGFTHIFSDQVTLDFSIEYIDADAEFGNDYANIGGEAMISVTF